MQCLNIKNKEVAALLEEYTKILGGENAAYYVLSENNGYGLDKAPNGAASKLYLDLMSHYKGDRNKAIQAKSKVFTDSFKNWFGDWLSKNESNEYEEAVNFLFDTNSKLQKIGTKEEYSQYLNTIFPKSNVRDVYWHGSDSDLTVGLSSTNKGKGSGAPETGSEMYFNKQPFASLQYISGVNRTIKDNDGFNNWVKLWWELKEALGNGRMQSEEWKNEIIGPNTRQYSPNKKGVFNRDKGGSNGKYLAERKARYGYENKTDKQFFEEVFDIRYGKETFNDWINRKRKEFKSIWNNKQVTKGIFPAILNVENPIVESGQNTYYEEQRGLFTKAKKQNNDAIISNSANNEFGSDVAVVFNPKDNVHFLGTPSDINQFENWKNSNKSEVSKAVDENGEPLYDTDVYYFFNPNQIKSIDNTGDFNTKDNNIYHKEDHTKFSKNDLAKYAEGNSPTALAIRVILDKFLTEDDIKNINIINIGRSGNYNYKTKTLNLSIDNDETPSSARSLVLHELMHTITSKYAYAYEKHLGIFNDVYYEDQETPTLTKEQIKIFKDLENTKKIVIKYINDNPEKVDKLNRKYSNRGLAKNIRYFMTEDNDATLHEFIAEVFSNPALIDLMSGIKTNNKYKISIFESFINLLSKLFNIDLNSTLFKDTVASVEALLNNKFNKESNENNKQDIELSHDRQQLNNYLSDKVHVSTSALLLKMIDLGMVSKELLPLAKALMKSTDLGVTYISSDLKGKVVGKYNAYSGNITLSKSLLQRDNEAVTSALLHEIIHRVSLNALIEPKTKKDEAFAKELQSIYAYYNSLDKATTDREYGFKDEMEFLSEYLSNVGFRDYLNRLEDTSFIKRIINAILDFIGISKRSKFRSNATSFINSNLEYSPLSFNDENIELEKRIKEDRTVIDEAKLTGNVRIDDIYKTLVPRMEARLKDIQHFKVLDTRRIDHLNNLINQLNKMQAHEQILYLIPDMANDVEDAYKRIVSISRKMKEAIMRGEDYNIDPEQLIQIKRSFLGFYSPIVKDIANLLTDPSSLNYLTENGVNQADIDHYVNDMKKVSANFTEISREYENLVKEYVEKKVIDYAKQSGRTDIEEIRKAINEVGQDIKMLEGWMFSPVHMNDALLGTITSMIVNTKNEVERKTLEKGKELVTQASKVKRSAILDLQEKSKDGVPTGYITRKLNYGQMKQDFAKFKLELADKYKLEDVYSIPDDPKERIAFNEELNNWLDSHVERRFTKKYYSLFNSLSEEAKAIKLDIDVELNALYSKALDENGNVEKALLSAEDWNKVSKLLHHKKNLGNRYDMFGVAKVGTEAEIAREIRELNKALSENVEYKTNKEKFKKAYLEAKAKYSGKTNKDGEDLFKLWMRRNTVVRVKQSFYDDISSFFETINDKEYTTLKERRNDLKKLYKDIDGNLNGSVLPDSVKKEWIEIETEMKAIEAAHKSDDTNSEFFNKADIVTQDAFSFELANAELEGEEAYQQWLSLNTVTVNGRLRPASFWTQMVPKDKSMWERIPTPDWNEVSTSSPFINPNFDASEGEYLVPKKSLYDNSKAYSAIEKNKELNKLRSMLLSTMEESNDNLIFNKNTDKYKLPQIDGRTLQTAFRQKGFKKFSKLLDLMFSIKDDDPNYVAAEKTLRADGSDLKLIPTRFMKMLDNPQDLTSDVVGSIIAYYNMATNYKEMITKAPELELISEQMGNREFKGKRGDTTNLYKKAMSMLDAHVYGRTKDRMEFKLPFTNKKISGSKILFGLSSYIRTTTLAHNPFVIATGYVTNFVNTRIEAISGLYFTNETLTQADKEMALNVFKAASNIGKLNHNNKIMGIMEYNQIVFDNHELFNNMDQSKVARVLNQRFWYGGHALVDYETKGRITLAIYFNYKLVNDKFLRFSEYRALHPTWDKKKVKQEWNRLGTTLYDAYEMKDNKIVLKEAYKDKVPALLIDRIQNTIKTISSRIDGQLNDIDRAAIHFNAYSQFLTMFRNFMIQLMQTRFKKKHFNYLTGIDEEGFYRTGAKAVSSIFYSREKGMQLKEIISNWQNLSDLEQSAVKRISIELVVAYMLFPAFYSVLAKNADDGDDDWGDEAMAYLMRRTALELGAPYKYNELYNMIKSPTAATPFIDTYLGLFDFSNFDDTRINRGPYENMTKFQRSLIKLTPFKSYIEATDPRSKRLYLDKQIIK